jgi:hypothetical protein
VTVEQVTPEQARRWIRHSHQRNTDLLKCRAMLDDVEGGRWDPARQEGRPVIVSTEKDTIADGHHRLVTILLHGEPLPCEVLYR